MTATIRNFAHMSVCNAIKRGELPKLDGSQLCSDCGAPAYQYDHRDYLLPLVVTPTCRPCNKARGSAMNSTEIRSTDLNGAIGLYSKTMHLMIESTETIKEMSEGAGVGFHWLAKFRQGRLPNPGVRTTQQLHDYLAAKAGTVKESLPRSG